LKSYLDASFLVSLYAPDTNSAAALHTVESASAILFITALAEVELVNALELRVFRKEASHSQVKSSLRDFQQDLLLGIFKMTPFPESVFVRARQLSQQTSSRLGTRTADILNVAAALELGADAFYSFDKQQRKLAQAVGLKLNPIP